MRGAERAILEAILPVPTAPFHEHGVRAALENLARAHGLDAARDAFGNLYVRHRGPGPRVAFTAHMDHPGFEIVAGGARARAVFLGGVKPECMSGAAVACWPVEGAARRAPVRGRIVRVATAPAPDGGRPQLVLDLDFDAPVASGDFGTFDVPGIEFEGDRLRGRALDNLMSCALVMSSLVTLHRSGASCDVLGVFTRAEEVGFVGAGGVLRGGVLEPERPIVVLETSKELPGFRIGGGPVLRVGDRMTSFDPRMDLWLSQRAAEVARREPGFTFQRALMTGGVCEASLYMVHGRRVGALALALGNYHNMTPESSIGAEWVSAGDATQLLALLEDLASHPPDGDLLDAKRTDLDATFARLAPRLGGAT